MVQVVDSPGVHCNVREAHPAVCKHCIHPHMGQAKTNKGLDLGGVSPSHIEIRKRYKLRLQGEYVPLCLVNKRTIIPEVLPKEALGHDSTAAAHGPVHKPGGPRVHALQRYGRIPAECTHMKSRSPD